MCYKVVLHLQTFTLREGENAMEEKEAKQMSLELMEATEVVYLSTIDTDGFPQTRAMANLRYKEEYPKLAKVFEGHEEDFLLYFATGASSAKMKHIEANQKGCVYFYRHGEMRGLMLAGNMEVVADAELKKQIWQDKWATYFADGAESAEYTVVRLVPTFAKGFGEEGMFRFCLGAGK